MSRFSRSWGVALCIVVLIHYANDSWASECAPNSPNRNATFGTVVSVSVSGSYTSEQLNAVYSGIDQWDTKCAGYSGPTVEPGSGGDVGVSVSFSPGQAPQNVGCGTVSLSTQNGSIRGASITIFATTSTGRACDRGGDTVAHEIGHVLGLGNADPNNQNCRGRIMGPRVIQSDGTTKERTVETDDCDEVERFMEPPDHTEEPEDPGAGGDGTCAV
jgi:hypothetical protein